jgi:uncharacterized membrane protein
LRPWWYAYSVALAVSSILSAALVQLRASGLPAGFWTTQQPANLLVSAAGIISVALLAAQMLRLSESSKADQKREALTNTCRQVLTAFHDGSGWRLPATTLAVHVWALPGRLERVFGGDPPLHRIETYRLARESRSKVRWTKGKGVLGRAWEREEALVADLSGLQKGGSRGATYFDARLHAWRWGISYDEFHQTRQYWSIFVQPLWGADRKLMGLLSVDCTHPSSATDLEAAADAARRELQIVEEAMQEIYSKRHARRGRR